MLGLSTKLQAAQPVLADAAKNVYGAWSRSSMVARVASAVVAGLVGAVGSVAISSKASKLFNSSKVTIDTSKSEEKIIIDTDTVETEKLSPKISRFQQVKQKIESYRKAIIATTKAHPYKAAAVIGGTALVVAAGLKVRHDQLANAKAQFSNGFNKFWASIPTEKYGEPTTTSSEPSPYAQEFFKSQADAQESINEHALNPSICWDYNETVEVDHTPVQAGKSFVSSIKDLGSYTIQKIRHALTDQTEFKAELKKYLDSIPVEDQAEVHESIKLGLIELSGASNKDLVNNNQGSAHLKFVKNETFYSKYPLVDVVNNIVDDVESKIWENLPTRAGFRSAAGSFSKALSQGSVCGTDIVHPDDELLLSLGKSKGLLVDLPNLPGKIYSSVPSRGSLAKSGMIFSADVIDKIWTVGAKTLNAMRWKNLPKAEIARVAGPVAFAVAAPKVIVVTLKVREAVQSVFLNCGLRFLHLLY